jgi:hypothetical protein
MKDLFAGTDWTKITPVAGRVIAKPSAMADCIGGSRLGGTARDELRENLP